MSYQWLEYLHMLSAVLFVAVHGTSMFVFYDIRGEKDRNRIDSLLAKHSSVFSLSGRQQIGVAGTTAAIAASLPISILAQHLARGA